MTIFNDDSHADESLDKNVDDYAFDKHRDSLIPNFLDWLTELNRWSIAAKTMSPDEATQTVFGGHPDGWKGDGWAWMENIPNNAGATTQLAQWISQGAVDPVLVLQQLRAQNWDYALTNEDDHDGQGVSLWETWAHAAGHAMALGRVPFGAHPDNKQLLEPALPLFYTMFHRAKSLGFSESHQQWLKETCEQHAWALDTVAHRMLSLYGDVPMWPWVFRDSLKEHCSVELVGQMLNALAQDHDFARLDNKTPLPRTNSALHCFASKRQGSPSLWTMPRKCTRHCMGHCMGPSQRILANAGHTQTRDKHWCTRCFAPVL